ncbi:ArnT family glycosyltransferase [Heyndrickxia acidicola]|uniref:Glycosyltransferase family 39 protein n=1 Tax=Heyndrickxia acidicola TaxID=209389 RepID=A0ABU6MLR6_9BACI|nr:glycosyltransferase family 39 protein [Heyndrickxia acidicola]MED1205624.1 glycosyltransferase family 39 protein [Heyndrickxia acidicola]
MAVLIAIFSYLVNRFLSAKSFLIILLAVGFGMRIVWIMMEKTPPASDFGVMYRSALKAVRGDFTFLHSPYYSSWVYQLGFTYYEALLLNLFGNQLFMLKLFNVFFSMGTTVLIYLIARKGLNECSARVAALLYTLYIPNVLYCSVLTNQYISTFMFILGIYFLIGKGLSEKYIWLWIGLALGMGNMMRPLGSFFLLGMGVFVFIYMILPFRKKESIYYIKRLAGVLLVYIIFQQLISFGFLQTGLSVKPLSNQEPYWKFTLGLNAHSNGTWNAEDQRYVNQFKVGQARNQAEKTLVQERLKDRKGVIRLFGNKFKAFWGKPDAGPYWAFRGLKQPILQLSLVIYERLMYIVSCLLIIGNVLLMKKENKLLPLLCIFAAGYAAVHLVIEIQTRYRFDILPVLFLLAGYGVYGFKQYIQDKLINRLN